MLRFGDTNIVKEKFYIAKKPIKLWHVNVDSIVYLKFIETKTNCRCLIGSLDKVIKPLVLIMPKIVNMFTLVGLGIFKTSFSWLVSLTPSSFHISRRTNLVTIQLYTTVKQPIYSSLKIKKNTEIVCYMSTSLVSL